MCRWLVYIGEKILLSDILITPQHSLLNQSLPNRALNTPDVKCSDYYNEKEHKKRNHNTNGDGFGVAWYTHIKHLERAHCFKSISPAWNDQNLVSISEGIESDVVFAHVRASSGSPISLQNCHPFKWDKYIFMHNGAIFNFSKVKKKIISMVSDEIFLNIQGNTDSEYAFALFLNVLNPSLKSRSFTAIELKDALAELIQIIMRLTGLEGPSSLNFAVSDGYTVVCSRFRNSLKSDPPTLYCAEGQCLQLIEIESPNPQSACFQSRVNKLTQKEMVINRGPYNKFAIVASEPLSFHQEDWFLIPRNHLLVLTHKKERRSVANVSCTLSESDNCEDSISIDSFPIEWDDSLMSPELDLEGH